MMNDYDDDFVLFDLLMYDDLLKRKKKHFFFESYFI